MSDFILAALPFAAAGIAIAAVAAGFFNRKKSKKKQGDWSMEGMCLGMSFGVIIGSVSSLDLGTCLSIGMLIGLAIGACIQKQDNGHDKEAADAGNTNNGESGADTERAERKGKDGKKEK